MPVLAKLLSQLLYIYTTCRRVFALIGASLIVGMMVLIVSSGFSRLLFGKSLLGSIEISEVLMVGIVYFGLAQAQQQKLNVRTELVTSRFPRKAQCLFSLLGLLTGLSIMIVVLGYTAEGAYSSFLIRETRFGVMSFPVWPAKAIVPLGSFFLCLQLLIDLVKETKNFFYSQKGGGDRGGEV